MRPALFLPQYWPVWLALGVLRLIERLPYPTMMRVGRALGRFTRRLQLPLVHVARRNIELCLPALSPDEREKLLMRHFECLGMTICESAMTWWSSREHIDGLSRIEGLEHLDAALARGKGAIILTSHFTTLEIGARILYQARPINVLYRPPKNRLLAHIAHTSRNRMGRGQHEMLILRDDIRTMVRKLRCNEAVWYAPDQAYRNKGAVMVPFFGIPAATNIFTSRLAQMTGATVLFYSHERLPDAGGYRVALHPALENFPSDDAVADTLRYHRFIEDEVRRIPEQYWWIHKRFKGIGAEAVNYYRRR